MSEKTLRNRLKKLFSTNVVIRNVGGTKLKVADTSRLQAFTSRTLYDRYSRIHRQNAGPYSSFQRADMGVAYQTIRLQLFRDYDIMDNDSIVASALDVYADETTVQSEAGESLIIESSDENIKDILHNLFYDILNIEFNLWPWTRNLCKYGDFFLFLEITEDYGIINVLPLSVYDTVRIEGQDPRNPYEVYFQSIGNMAPKDRFENYEIAHFRLLSDSNFLPYGRAMIEPARRTWKQLQLMEDAMLVHRLVRAPDRRFITVDIGNIAPSEVDSSMENLLNKMKRVPLVDQNTGDYNLKFNLMNIIEDYYLPVRGSDSGTKIENLPGLQFNAIEDVEYLRNKLLGSLKIPRAFLGYEEQLSGKATLAAEDVRFARTIERIQRIIVSELTKIAIVHLYAQGYTDESLVDFSLNLTNPSTIYEQEKIALWQEKISLASSMQQTNLIGSDWIYDHVFGMSEDEWEDMRLQVVKDKKRSFRYASIEQGEDPANPTGTDGANPEAIGSDEAQPQSIEDLPTEDEVRAQQKEGKVGRPKEGIKRNTDKHPLGRDPFGAKENSKALHRDPEGKIKVRRTGLSRESVGHKDLFKQLKSKFPHKDQKTKEVLSEVSYMDEEVLDIEE